MKKNLPHSLAESLAAQIQAGQLATLPSINALARQHRVAYFTMWKAVQLLKAKGLLTGSQGRKYALNSSDGPTLTDTSPTQARIAATIRRRIQDGDYRIGNSLPKVEFLAHSEGSSPSTVCAAIGMLCKEKILHKQGKRWIVGPSPRSAVPPARAANSLSTPVILVILTDAFEWYSSYNSFTAPFAITFGQEIGRFGFRAQLALVQHDGGLKGIPSGIDNVMKLARQLGNLYSGAIALGRPDNAPDLRELLLRLSKLRRPVVLFDHSGEYPDYSRESLSAGTAYHRLHATYDAAYSLVLKTLVDRGHRVVGIPNYTLNPNFDWVERRIELLRKSIEREKLPLEIVVVPQEERFWSFFTPYYLDAFLVNFRNQTGQQAGELASQDIVAQLVKQTPSLRSLINDPRITAIVAPNDDMAREYYFWLTSVGLSIPGDISLISFDNKPDTQYLPITTVDFGFQNLGYRAAHIFINDLPVRTGRSGDLAGTCTMMDRGSVGRPGRRNLPRFRT